MIPNLNINEHSSNYVRPVTAKTVMLNSTDNTQIACVRVCLMVVGTSRGSWVWVWVKVVGVGND